MNIEELVTDIHQNVEKANILLSFYEENVKKLEQKAAVAFSDVANEANEGDFEFFNAIVSYIKNDLERIRQFKNLISMQQNVFINALEDHDMAFLQFNVAQGDQLQREIYSLQTLLSNREQLDKFNESLGDILGDYQGLYHEALVAIRSLFEPRLVLQNELRGFSHDLESIRIILEQSISIGKIPGDLTVDDISHISVEAADSLSSHINALVPIEDGVSNIYRDTSLDVFLPQQLCHVKS